MNQTIFDEVMRLKKLGYNWAYIADTIDKDGGTHYFNEKTKSGEALRSAYRRFKRRKLDKLKSVSDIAVNISTTTGTSFTEAFDNLSRALGSMSTVFNKEETAQETTDMPISLPATFDAPLQLELKGTLVIADLHCPYHHEQALQNALALQPEQIIIAGDLFDFASISRFTKSEQSRLESDLEIAGLVLLELACIAPVIIVSGNHDERLVAKLDTALRFSRVVSMALNGRVPENTITVSDYDYCYVGDTYVVGHLSQYSKDPGKVAAQMARKYQRHCLVGHDHIVGMQTHNGKPDGKYIGASVGSMTDGSKHWYAQRRLNTFPEWEQGYAYINEYSLNLYRGDGTCYFWQDTDDEGWLNMYRGGV